MTIKEAWRDVDTISASINTMYKLELLKLPQEVKDMKWDDYYKQSLDKGQNPLALSEAISSCVDDSLCASIDTQVSQLKSAMKSTVKKGDVGIREGTRLFFAINVILRAFAYINIIYIFRNYRYITFCFLKTYCVIIHFTIDFQVFYLGDRL